MGDVRNKEMSTLWYSQYLFLMCNMLHSNVPVQSGYMYVYWSRLFSQVLHSDKSARRLQ